MNVIIPMQSIIGSIEIFKNEKLMPTAIASMLVAIAKIKSEDIIEEQILNEENLNEENLNEENLNEE